VAAPTVIPPDIRRQMVRLAVCPEHLEWTPRASMAVAAAVALARGVALVVDTVAVAPATRRGPCRPSLGSRLELDTVRRGDETPRRAAHSSAVP